MRDWQSDGISKKELNQPWCAGYCTGNKTFQKIKAKHPRRQTHVSKWQRWPIEGAAGAILNKAKKAA